MACIELASICRDWHRRRFAVLRKFIWFAVGIPESLIVHSERFGVVPLAPKGRALLANVTRSTASLAAMFQSAADMVEIIYISDLADSNEAFDRAYRVATGIVDVYSFMTIQRPTLLPVVCIHENGQENSELLLFEYEGTGIAYAGEKMHAAVDSLHRCVFDNIIPAFDIALGQHSKAKCELAQKIASAARMFHHGREAKDNQVQFLCYFTSLETIVCGSRLYGHGPLLKKRITQLFRNKISEEQVAELWQMRCGAAHEGSGTWTSLTPALPDVKKIATACLLFAIAQLKYTDSIEGAWTRIQHYELPPEVVAPDSFFAFATLRASQKLCSLGMISREIEGGQETPHPPQ